MAELCPLFAVFPQNSVSRRVNRVNFDNIFNNLCIQMAQKAQKIEQRIMM